MSRLIVKNLPKGITAKKLEDLFASKGVITDLQLKFNKDGVFRQFAFVGYKTEEEANAAKEYFNNTFVHTSKITVEKCSDLGDPNKPRPWKKALNVEKTESKDKRLQKVEIKKNEKHKKFDIPEELKEDPKFKQFLKVNEDRKSKPAWAEDVDNSESEEYSSENESNISDKEGKDTSEKEISKNEEETSNVKIKSFDDTFTIKIKNLPYQCKKTQIKKFFQPLKIFSLRLPPKKKGFAYVSFKTEKDLKKALIKHRGFLDGHRVDVIKYTKKDYGKTDSFNKKFPEPGKESNEELLAETGRIFVRNLCNTVTEEDIKELFTKYGPAEVHIPIDFTTKKCKGFAFVTFMFAEDAVKAFGELDGIIFQGRLLHLIPAQPKKEFEIDENEMNFKKKKEAKKKKDSSNSQHQNILFLGMNAVADIIAETHGIEKSKLLSGGSKESVAVRMALAETKMVANTRKFLIENGVQLDAFSQPAAERSKTVIVVKHLPAKTKAEEINELFSKHGPISRVLVPPSGLIALVEFENPSEAKKAFHKLAYKQFHNVPLLLEWAPINGLKDPPVVTETETKEEDKITQGNEAQEISHDHKEDISPEEGTTIFVKNISFDATDEAFKKHFKQCGDICSATISKKKDIKAGKVLSMGFGFVQFAKREAAIYALQNLQHSVLNGRALEIKFANRSIVSADEAIKQKKKNKKQISSKILVKNIPFQASIEEVRDLFKVFGALKSVRLPKKLGKPDEHRGFGFVEYVNSEDAARAFDSLCHSTHLFNRRLDLEWANTDSESVSEIRKKTATHYIEGGPKKKLKKSQLKEDIVVAAARYQTAGEDIED